MICLKKFKDIRMNNELNPAEYQWVGTVNQLTKSAIRSKASLRFSMLVAKEART